MITQDGETGQELERRDLVEGYEFRKGKYLLLSDDDLDSVKVECQIARNCAPHFARNRDPSWA
jgi:non-homologous end joining protein Ku